jgi:hypothetical protein
MKHKSRAWLTTALIVSFILACSGGGGDDGGGSNNTALAIVSNMRDYAGINEPISITFNKPMDTSTINASSFLVNDGTGNIAGTISYNSKNNRVTFTPSTNLLPSIKYTITLTSDVKDAQGNSIGGYFITSYTTGKTISVGTWRSIAKGLFFYPFNPYVWTGTEVLIWDRTSQYVIRYKPSTDTWSRTPISSNIDLDQSSAIWTGSEMIVWGGQQMGTNNGTILLSNIGIRFNPATNTFKETSTVNAPSERSDSFLVESRYMNPITVWTGAEMIVWGGQDYYGNYLNTGGAYNPSTDTWRTISNINAPSARGYFALVWTGSEVIVWGGVDISSNILPTGGIYKPSTDTWRSMSATNSPSINPTYSRVVWTGSEMMVWGINGGGGKYNPSTDSWSKVSDVNVPDISCPNSNAIWTGSEMIIWGGLHAGLSWCNGEYTHYRYFGARYNPSTDSWIATTVRNAPYISGSLNVWTGSEMVVLPYFEDSNQPIAGGAYKP